MRFLQCKILEEAYRILPTNISIMNCPNRQKEKVAQHKYCANLSNADLERVLFWSLCLTNWLSQTAHNAWIIRHRQKRNYSKEVWTCLVSFLLTLNKHVTFWSQKIRQKKNLNWVIFQSLSCWFWSSPLLKQGYKI